MPMSLICIHLVTTAITFRTLVREYIAPDGCSNATVLTRIAMDGPPGSWSSPLLRIGVMPTRPLHVFDEFSSGMYLGLSKKLRGRTSLYGQCTIRPIGIIVITTIFFERFATSCRGGHCWTQCVVGDAAVCGGPAIVTARAAMGIRGSSASRIRCSSRSSTKMYGANSLNTRKLRRRVQSHQVCDRCILLMKPWAATPVHVGA
mmetsp:Transcript_127132/g.247741  ORF Transcript_127132/g.247741 Transcript_127132/m.247741 type:complete len:203 (-) Transcript_127132:330-938(-)